MQEERNETDMKAGKYIGWVLLLLLMIALGYYISFPAINIHEEGVLIFVIMVVALLGVVCMLNDAFSGKKHKKNKIYKGQIDLKIGKPALTCFAVAIVLVAVYMIGSLSGAEIFRAKDYASLLSITEYDFAENIEETENVDNVALMDTDSARTFGNRMIGSLSDVVSQYEVEDDYTQINIEGKPYKVAALRYASFFKFWKNKDAGIPGYVKVNPVTFKAEYVKLDKGMKYVPSGYFNYNLQRHVQFKYPTKIINDYYFEVDNEGNPYFICPVVTAKIGLFGGKDVIGAVLCDPISGDCEYYDVEEIPAWVDRVYDGDLLSQKYDWAGSLSGGFWNSIISQTGCKQATDDYGYKTIGDDVWVYTGVTSVTGDQSNVGFILMNQRTSEARYYSVSGAEEHSAMSAAEGEVQEKGYRASFPSLINVSGQPTYIMVLKDAGGLVKMYAMVNVEQYNIVATATSQGEIFKKYKKLLSGGAVTNSGGDKEEDTVQTQEIVIKEVNYILNDGATTVYIKDTNNKVYKQPFAEDERLAMLTAGQTVEITYEDVEDGISYMSDFEIKDQGLQPERSPEPDKKDAGETD